MPKYTITTFATVSTEYTVVANNEDEAREKYYDGDVESSAMNDYEDEQIHEIVAVDVEKENLQPQRGH